MTQQREKLQGKVSQLKFWQPVLFFCDVFGCRGILSRVASRAVIVALATVFQRNRIGFARQTTLVTHFEQCDLFQVQYHLGPVSRKPREAFGSEKPTLQARR